MSEAPRIYPLPLMALPGTMAIMPAPPGGDGLAAALSALPATLGTEAADTTLVCLVEAAEVAQLSLEDEGAHFEALGGSFIHFPIPDRSVPADDAAFIRLAGELLERLRNGQCVIAHCWGGIGRSGLLACTIGCLAGGEPNDLKARISAARETAVPESAEQHHWLERHFSKA